MKAEGDGYGRRSDVTGVSRRTGIADAFELQAALPEDTRADYAYAVVQELHKALGSDECVEDWANLTATPRQRCLAMRKAMEVQG